MSLTHFKNKNKNIEMVDISKKKQTNRIAEAESFIRINKNLYKLLLMMKTYLIIYVIQLKLQVFSS